MASILHGFLSTVTTIPVKLRHGAPGEGVHARTDAEGRELAQAIRLVLDDLAERMDAALKDHAELSSAVSRLMKRG